MYIFLKEINSSALTYKLYYNHGEICLKDVEHT